MSVFDKYTDSNFRNDQHIYTSVFEHFDRNRSTYLENDEFYGFLQDLLTPKLDGGQSLMERDAAKFLSALDLDHDGRLSLSEFGSAWAYWVKQILKPVKALVIVDVQNDFISGSLSLSNCSAGQDGSAVVPVINRLLDQNLFDVVVYTYDWHPESHISFIDNIHMRTFHPMFKVPKDDVRLFDKVVFEVDGSPREQIMWPRHCIQGSWGSQLHRDLKVVENAFHIKKGTNPDIDSYSAFWDNNKESKTELSSILSEKQVTDVYVCGLAYDVCVAHTASQSVSHGFRTVFIEDATRGVTLDGIAKSKEELMAKGVYFTESEEVPSLTTSKHRPLCLAVQAASNYKLALTIIGDKTSAS